MIQDISPHKLDNQYSLDKASADDYVLCFAKDNLLVADSLSVDYKIIFPKVSDFSKDAEFIYLFSVDNEKYFMMMIDNEEDISIPGFEFKNVRDIRNGKLGPKHFIYAAMTGKHLKDWYRDVKFCGRCGNKMEHSTTERAMQCSCGYTAYPRIMPAVIVGVRNGDKLLLTKYKTGYQHNALIAGFTEIGETVEETVAREVMEEAGIKVKNISYYKSQPWGVANDILMGFYCDVDGDTEIHMDSSELKYAEWVKREDIILQPDEFSLTNEMMKKFKDGLM